MTAKDNVHLHEINKFGSMAERWWDTQENLKPCMILTRYGYNLSKVMQILP